MLFENFKEEEITLTSKQNRDIKISVKQGKIMTVDNKSGVNFPFKQGQMYNASVKSWAKNNNFKWNGQNLDDEKKVFGIKAKDIPKGHELRTMFPNKFK